MEPLQITAYLASPIAINRKEDIALDGILAYEVLRRHFGADFYTLPDPKELLYFARLPLDMRGRPSAYVASLDTGHVWQTARKPDVSLWHWACSSAQMEILGHDTTHWNKRIAEDMTDYIDFGGKRGRILDGEGCYKSYHMPLHRVVAQCITWYAYGDNDAMASLLAPVVAIGKKYGSGNGHVVSWEIAPMDKDSSTWCDDQLVRPLPGQLAAGIAWNTPCNLEHIAFRAPQWHTANQALCAVGGRRCA